MDIHRVKQQKVNKSQHAFKFSTFSLDSFWTIRHETQGIVSELNSSLFECNSGEIVSFSVICDSFRDCADNSDENKCRKYKT